MDESFEKQFNCKSATEIENQMQIFEHVMVHKLLYTSIRKSGVSIEKYTIECWKSVSQTYLHFSQNKRTTLM